MGRPDILGAVIKQAREEKKWTEQELADKLRLDVESIQELEAGNGNPLYTTMAELFFLLEISPDIVFLEDDLEETIRTDRLYRELLSLTPERYERITKAASQLRRWREAHPGVVTVEDYWEAVNAMAEAT